MSVINRPLLSETPVNPRSATDDPNEWHVFPPALAIAIAKVPSLTAQKEQPDIAGAILLFGLWTWLQNNYDHLKIDGRRHCARSLSELAKDHSYFTKPGIEKILKRMEAKGFLYIRRDRKKLHFWISEAATDLCKKRKGRVWFRIQDAVLYGEKEAVILANLKWQQGNDLTCVKDDKGTAYYPIGPVKLSQHLPMSRWTIGRKLTKLTNEQPVALIAHPTEENHYTRVVATDTSASHTSARAKVEPTVAEVEDDVAEGDDFQKGDCKEDVNEDEKWFQAERLDSASPSQAPLLNANIPRAIDNLIRLSLSKAKAGKLIDLPSDKLTNSSVDQLASLPSNKLTGSSTDRIASSSSNKLTNLQPNKRTSSSNNKPTALPSDKQASSSVDQLTSTSTDKLTSSSSDRQTNLSSDKLARQSTDKTTSSSVEIDKLNAEETSQTITIVSDDDEIEVTLPNDESEREMLLNNILEGEMALDVQLWQDNIDIQTERMVEAFQLRGWKCTTDDAKRFRQLFFDNHHLTAEQLNSVVAACWDLQHGRRGGITLTDTYIKVNDSACLTFPKRVQSAHFFLNRLGEIIAQLSGGWELADVHFQLIDFSYLGEERVNKLVRLTHDWDSFRPSTRPLGQPILNL